MNKSFFKNNKFSIEFIMLLLSVIILSVLIYIGIKYEKGYVKNFEYEFEEYNYEKNIFHSKEGNIRLIDSRSFNGIVTDVKMLDYGALATYKNKSNNECGIKLIDYKKNTIRNIARFNLDQNLIHYFTSLSPSKNILIYGVTDQKKDVADYYLHDLKNNKTFIVGTNLMLLNWKPDSSGFIAMDKNNNVIEYDIESRKSSVILKLDDNKDIYSLIYSSDATKVFMLCSESKGKKFKYMIISYDKDKNKAEVLRETDSSDNSWIIHVDVIDENNLIILDIKNGKDKLYLLNINNKSEKIIETSKLYKIYLNQGRDKLINIYNRSETDSEIRLFNIKFSGSNIDVYKFFEIDNIKGFIPSLDINNNFFVYPAYDKNNNKSMLYFYEIYK